LPPIVGLSGHSGSGKSTAIVHLRAISGGGRVYLGGAVLAEVVRLGLPQNRESEREVRVAMREEHGEACLVAASLGLIQSHLDAGRPVFIDAIFCPEEFDRLQSAFGSIRVLRLEASFDVRAARLRTRTDRPFSIEELAKRDQTEAERLGTASVLADAAYSILNEGDLASLHSALELWWREVTSA
jgi:dephospho-CoA kinase